MLQIIEQWRQMIWQKAKEVWNDWQDSAAKSRIIRLGHILLRNFNEWRQMIREEAKGIWNDWQDAGAKSRKDWQKAQILDNRGLLITLWISALLVWSSALLVYLVEATSFKLLLSLLVAIAIRWLLVPYVILIVKVFYFSSKIGFIVFLASAFVFLDSLARASIYLIPLSISGCFIGLGFFVRASRGVEFDGAFPYVARSHTHGAYFGILIGILLFVLNYRGLGIDAVYNFVFLCFAVMLVDFFIISIMKRAEKMQLLADDLRKKEGNKPDMYPEFDEARASRVQDCHSLIYRHSYQTVGLAGRRGLGKTNLLYLLSEKYEDKPANSIKRIIEKNGGLSVEKEDEPEKIIDHENDLRNAEKLRNCRVRRWHLFIRCPADFGEMSFLMAMLEQMALKVNSLLTRLLPAVKPYLVERELEEKRRWLRFSHFIYLAIAITLLISVGWAYWQSNISDPLLKSFVRSQTAVATTIAKRTHSKLYIAKMDSLAQVLEPKVRVLKDSLQRINSLLNPSIGLESWNRKGDWKKIIFEHQFLIDATYDSLLKSTSWPRIELLDSLRAIVDSLRRPLDSIEVREKRYAALQDSLQSIRHVFGLQGSDSWEWIPFYATFIIFPIAFIRVWVRTREGAKRLRRPVYDPVRNEIALYERTNDLLERLRYHMTFGEGQEIEVTASPFEWVKWLGFGGRHSRHVSRELRPFTVLSLVEEYRSYMTDVVFYLNNALRESGGEENNHLQIVIAIDELDKVLDTKRLHELLKSIKAIFDLNDVYYLLSISEDALETYRLRHVETKNEIDSAFVHIFSVPPMGAKASLGYFLAFGKKWPTAWLPAAIVFGGGIPRDMRRLAQLFDVRQEEWNSLDDCLEYLHQEDLNAAINLIKNTPCLSIEWRRLWIRDIERAIAYTEDEVDGVLDKLERLDYDKFVRENPCSDEEAKKTFHQMRALLVAMTIKGHIYYSIKSVKQLQAPFELTQYPEYAKNPEDAKTYILNVPAEVDDWLKKLQPLTSAIFDLAANPLGVWEKLRESVQDEKR